jgi:hypothetical protein
MSKQTAVEWFAEKVEQHLLTFGSIQPRVLSKFKQEAKAMEKQQSISDYCEGFKASGEGWNGEYGLNNMLDVAGQINAEDYYNKTYGGDK